MSGIDIDPNGRSAVAILAVDDVPANLLALSAIIEPLGERLATAKSGREALALAARDPFALILLDVRLPDMDGFETLSRLRAIPHAQHTPVILLTAYELSTQALDHAQGLGLVDYILKPIPPALLRSKVSALLSLHRRDEEIRHRDEALAAKDRHIAMLAHDLQNPLTAILMAAHKLGRGDLDAASRATAERITGAAMRMSDMVRNLTDYAHVGRGPIPISPAPMDLGELCRDVMAEYREADPARQIGLRCEGRLDGEWDTNRLHQAVSNLIGNALRYGEGEIDVRAREAGAHVEVAIHNGGPPVPPERLPVIFHPFERGAQAGVGLGLGLFIVREIVKAHAGDVSVTSSAEAGTTFVLRLPRRG